MSDPYARGVSGDEIERAQEMARRGAAAQDAVNELGAGEVQVVSTPTIYLATLRIDDENGATVLKAFTTLESAKEFCVQTSAVDREWLTRWKQLGSGTWTIRVADTNEYYEILTLPVLP